jgi:hypothetical protein
MIPNLHLLALILCSNPFSSHLEVLFHDKYNVTKSRDAMREKARVEEDFFLIEYV